MFAVILLLALSGCSKGLVGTYRCTGIPDLNALTLESDGSYTSTGDILGHATSGSGKYKADGRRVTLKGSYRVEGLTLNEPNDVVLDRQRNGDLKSLLTTCKKR
jgi:hypothetical protein